MYMCPNPPNIQYREWPIIQTIDFEWLWCINFVSPIVTNVPDWWGMLIVRACVGERTHRKSLYFPISFSMNLKLFSETFITHRDHYYTDFIFFHFYFSEVCCLLLSRQLLSYPHHPCGLMRTFWGVQLFKGQCYFSSWCCTAVTALEGGQCVFPKGSGLASGLMAGW